MRLHAGAPVANRALFCRPLRSTGTSPLQMPDAKPGRSRAASRPTRSGRVGGKHGLRLTVDKVWLVGGRWGTFEKFCCATQLIWLKLHGTGLWPMFTPTSQDMPSSPWAGVRVRRTTTLRRIWGILGRIRCRYIARTAACGVLFSSAPFSTTGPAFPTTLETDVPDVEYRILLLRGLSRSHLRDALVVAISMRLGTTAMRALRSGC